MSLADLLKEAKQKATEVAKLRLSIKMQKEKDSAKYKREKKYFARLQTIISRKRNEQQAVPSPEAK